MGRAPRITEAGTCYHLLNRRVMRLPLFEKDADYLAFEWLLDESLGRPDAPRLLSYCLMPNHWHLVVQAGRRSNLSTWMQWVTVTHTHRWHVHHHTVGEGPLYQGRFKSFPVQEETHFLVLCRYVEGNAFRAGLVERAEAWRWGSLWAWRSREVGWRPRLTEWPVDRPADWVAEVNLSLKPETLSQVRRSVARGAPLGSEAWRCRIAARLGLDLTLRPRGRPTKQQKP